MPNDLFLSIGKGLREKAAKKAKVSPSHRRARKQEKESAKSLRGMLTPASGAKDIKGDVRVRGVLRLECKTTKHKSFSVTLEMVRKIEEAALGATEVPAILVEFNDGRGNKIADVAIVPGYLLEQLCQ